MVKTLNDNDNRNVKIALIASCAAVIAILVVVSVFLLVRDTTPEPATTSTEFIIPAGDIYIADKGLVDQTGIICKNSEIGVNVWPRQVVEYGDCEFNAFGRIKGTKKVIVTVERSTETKKITKITIAPYPR